VTETESIPFQTKYVAAPEREIDEAATIQPGATGRRVRQVLLGYENGVEVARQTERESVEQEPQPRIIHYGTKPVFRTLSSPSGPIQYWRKMRVYATWYHPGSAGKPASAPGYGITSLGVAVQRGVIAVDPRVIPYRTQMYVPGYGIGVAADTGGGVRGNIIDLGFSDDEDHDWLSQWLDIYITGPAPDPSQIKPPA
ncbi:MAG: G5 domain-containing protein, partial [Chloroflexota bacterium]